MPNKIRFSTSHARKHLAGLAVATSLVLTLVGAAMASSLLLTTKQTCSVINCNALELKGALSGTGSNINNPRSVPWLAQVAGETGTCLRFDVIQSSGVQFLEMTVISPNNSIRTFGTILNDPTKDCCPKVIVGSVPKSGFYTVMLNNNGGDTTQATFTLKYQAYNQGNKNCQSPTHQD